MVHAIFDDSRARLSPEEGGLGYKGGWTTVQGLYKTVVEHKRGWIASTQRSDTAGVSLAFAVGSKQRGGEKFREKVKKMSGKAL